MTFTHDLVIIGATSEGIHAAREAIHLKKRVALVQQPFSGHEGLSETLFSLTSSRLARYYRLLNQWEDPALWPRWERFRAWLTEVDAAVKERDCLAALAAIGVDVIEGSGEFVRLPRSGFVTENRKLFAPSYLIATGYRSEAREIWGLAETGYLQPRDIRQMEDLNAIPDRVAIVGDTPITLQLSQLLQRFDKKITLVTAADRLLPEEDRDISRLVSAILEAEGIEILTGESVSQVKAIDGQKWLQLNDRALETGEIAISGEYRFNHEGLNLEAMGITVENGRISADLSLRTANPRIFLCSGLEYGYPDPSLDRYRASIAVENAVFARHRKLDPALISRIIPLDPPIARVGLNEMRARQRYGDSFKILSSPVKHSIAFTLTSESTGFYKILVREDGKILGASFIGSGAEEAIAPIALAINENLPISSLRSALYPFATRSAIIGEIGDSFPRRRSWLDRLRELFRFSP